MAYLLRSMAVIGVIAFHSPVLGPRQTAGEAPAPAATSLAMPDIAAAAGSLTAARETARIVADLDPQTRARLFALALEAASGATASPGKAHTAPTAR